MPAARSCNSFFHSPTCVGCTPSSWAISFTVLIPRTASSATLALYWPLKFLRFRSLTTCSFLSQATILNYYYPKIGVHYRNKFCSSSEFCKSLSGYDFHSHTQLTRFAQLTQLKVEMDFILILINSRSAPVSNSKTASTRPVLDSGWEKNTSTSLSFFL